MSVGKFLRKKGVKAVKRSKAPSTLKTAIKVGKTLKRKKPIALDADSNMKRRLKALKKRQSVKAL